MHQVRPPGPGVGAGLAPAGSIGVVIRSAILVEFVKSSLLALRFRRDLLLSWYKCQTF